MPQAAPGFAPIKHMAKDKATAVDKPKAQRRPGGGRLANRHPYGCQAGRRGGTGSQVARPRYWSVVPARPPRRSLSTRSLGDRAAMRRTWRASCASATSRSSSAKTGCPSAADSTTRSSARCEFEQPRRRGQARHIGQSALDAQRGRAIPPPSPRAAGGADQHRCWLARPSAGRVGRTLARLSRPHLGRRNRRGRHRQRRRDRAPGVAHRRCTVPARPACAAAR